MSGGERSRDQAPASSLGSERAQVAGRAHPVATLQRLVGNRAVRRLIAAEAPEAAPPGVEAAVEGARGGGEALAGELRERMEAAFGGVELGHVRLHRDDRADGAAAALGASAFTTGADVFFRAGSYDPAGSPGRRLLAHELAHVVQQAGAPIQRALVVSPPNDAFEEDADLAAGQVMRELEAPAGEREGEGVP